MVPFDRSSQKRMKEQIKKLTTDKQVNEVLYKTIESVYGQREQQVGEPVMREIEKFVMLSTIDKLWIDHLDAIDDLRDGIGLRGYAQRDPLVEYKAEAFNSFEKLMGSIDYEIARKVFRVQVSRQQPPPPPQGEEVKPPEPRPETVEPKSVTPPTKTRLAGEASDFSKAFAGAGQNIKPTGNVPAGKPAGQKTKKIGRNDPCWCGSGKKWKKCHYPEKG